MKIDPYLVPQKFYDWSPTLQACVGAGYSADKLREFVARSFSSRCSKLDTLLKRTRPMVGFLEFAGSRGPPAPICGKGETPAIAEWLEELKARGEHVPRAGRAAISVFGIALWVEFPLGHPSVEVTQRISKMRRAKHAPVVPLELAFALETYAGDGPNDRTISYFCSALCLMLFASLRFCDTIEIKEFWVANSEVCGISVGQKSKGRALMTWAAPRKGFRTKGAWLNPLLAYWEKYKPVGDAFRYLF